MGLLLLLLMTRAALPASEKFVIVDVFVNGGVQKPTMIVVTHDGAILVRRDDVASWGLTIPSTPVELLRAIVHIRLSNLLGVQARLDATTLQIYATEAAFEGTHIDLQKKTVPLIDSGSGAYVNYDVTYYGGRGQRPASAAALEGVYYIDALSFASNGVFSSSTLGRQFVRYESSMRWDFPDRVQSLMVGDAISHSGTLARAFRFGGISYGSNFTTRPDLVTFALPALPGESRVPTSAELLINGHTHSRFDLNPGPFEISNVPAINGAGEIQLVTRDPLGRQQVLVVPYYVTPSLLRPGLTDAGFDAGKVREDFGLASTHYGRGFARGTMRRGITPGMTVEGFAETVGGQHVVGGGATMAIGSSAVASAAIARSNSGTSIWASLERVSLGISFGLRSQYASRQFAQLGELGGLHYRLNANVGMSLGVFGNVSVVHAAEARYDHGRAATTALSYQRQIAKTLSVLANFSATRTGEKRQNFAGLAFVMPLDALTSASLASTHQNGNSEHVLDVRRNLPSDAGWATRVRVTASDAHSPRADAGATWQNAAGQWSADASHASSGQNLRLGMNGSLVIAGGMVRPVRQLGDAFAIVSVPGHPGIDVFHENQRVGQTDASGFAVIPNLRAYQSNAVSLDTLKLSLSTELSAPRRQVTPARRAGVLLTFKATVTRGSLVRIVTENGDAVPAGAMLSIRGESFPVATNGEAWVTGLDAETDALVEWGAQRCAVRIPAADASKARPRIGPLTCKAGRA